VPIAQRLKLVVLGHSRAGKTTLLRTLQQLVSGEKDKGERGPSKSTVAIDEFELPLHSKIEFTVWDFAGQIEYLTTHQVHECFFFFLQRRKHRHGIQRKIGSAACSLTASQHFISLNTIYVVVVDISQQVKAQVR
jgi:GTPase SAR1 family protein